MDSCVNESMKKEAVKLVIRQTNYDKEKANEELIKKNINYIKLLKNY